MTTRFFQGILVIMIWAVLATGQEKPTPIGKPGPERRPLGVALPDSTRKATMPEEQPRSTQALPKFDLPDYVITGAVTIDLPDNAKREPKDPELTVYIADPALVSRDRSTLNFSGEEKDLTPLAATEGHAAKFHLSSGTFFTSRVGLWYALRGTDYVALGSAEYGISKAFVPFAHRSRGSINLGGRMTLSGPDSRYDGGVFGGVLGYASETYRFYGSQSPALTRSLSRIQIGAGYTSPRDLLFNYEAGALLSLNNFSDSTTTLTETQFSVRGKSNLLVGPLPLDGSLDVSFASVSGSSSRTLPFLEATLDAGRQWLGNFTLKASVHFYLAQGMLGQRVVKVYPHLSVGYRFLDNTLLSFAYAGRVQHNTLSSLVAVHSYLSSASTVRQSDLPLDVAATLETDWTAAWRTSVSARVQSFLEYPLFNEGAMKGTWLTDYRGTTRVITYQADLFAKFDANSYLALSAEINSSRNSSTQGKVPYLPDFRLSSGGWIEIRPGLTLHPTVVYVGSRRTDLIVAGEVKGYFAAGIRAEFSVFQNLSFTVECQNITNTRYEEWRGYREVPFTIVAGLNFRW